MGQDWVGQQMPEWVSVFGRHMVVLSWYEGRYGPEGELLERPEPYIASAFTVLAADELWLLTAGHVFTDRSKRGARGIGYSKPWICDAWSPAAKHSLPIPFDFFDDSLLRFVVNRNGIDFAAIPLSQCELIAKALVQTITPFRGVDWAAGADEEYDGYAVIGFPGELVDVVEKQVGPNRQSMTCYPAPELIRLHRFGGVEDPELHHLRKQLDRTWAVDPFVARLESACPIESLVGMSGGPIIGLRSEADGTRYFPLAIQSSCFHDSRVIIGTPLAEVLGEFERLLTMDSRETDVG